MRNGGWTKGLQETARWTREQRRATKRLATPAPEEAPLLTFQVIQDGRIATVYAESEKRALRMPGVTGLA